MAESSVPELAIQAGAGALLDGDEQATDPDVQAGCLSLAEDVVDGIERAGYRIVRDLQVLRLGPGDRLACLVDQDISTDQALRLKAELVRWSGLEPYRVTVICGGRLALVRDEGDADG